MEQKSLLDLTITAAAIATFTASIIASIVSILLFRLNTRRDEKKRLDECIFNINSHWLAYPYLESIDFINDWNKNNSIKKEDERYLRYEAYCTLWFNCLFGICTFYKYDKDKIENYIYIKEVIVMHNKWWSHPPDEIDKYSLAYDEKFRNFINKYLS